jgi:hypothetical protein
VCGGSGLGIAMPYDAMDEANQLKLYIEGVMSRYVSLCLAGDAVFLLEVFFLAYLAHVVAFFDSFHMRRMLRFYYIIPQCIELHYTKCKCIALLHITAPQPSL